MPRKTSTKSEEVKPVEAAVVEEKATAPAEVRASKKGKDSVIVTFPGGSRVYSKEVHGEDFEALAEEFAEKKGGEVM